MTRLQLPNFHGHRALIVHVDDRNRALLAEHLQKLGLRTQTCWPAERLAPDVADLILFDADMGFDDLFAWAPGHSQVPLIALMGSEAPGRIEWALSQAPSAFLTKPIRSNGVFSALAIAFHTFAAQREQRQLIETLNLRIKARPLVLRAILMLMRERKLNDTDAFHVLRAESMKRRVSVEELCQQLVARAGRSAPELRTKG